MLALAPGTISPAPGAGANTGPRRPPHRYTADTALDRAKDDYFTWLDHI